jgi:hypothetical protein
MVLYIHYLMPSLRDAVLRTQKTSTLPFIERAKLHSSKKFRLKTITKCIQNLIAINGS